MPNDVHWRHRLTARERAVAKSLAHGMSYREIADHLHISFHTVASHVKSILHKTGQPSSRRLAALIRDQPIDDEDIERAS